MHNSEQGDFELTYNGYFEKGPKKSQATCRDWEQCK